MRPFASLVASSLFLVTGCAGTYEHVAGGALVGGVAGGMAGVACCNKPSDAGPGILIGIAVGALVGLMIDWVDPV